MKGIYPKMHDLSTISSSHVFYHSFSSLVQFTGIALSVIAIFNHTLLSFLQAILKKKRLFVPNSTIPTTFHLKLFFGFSAIALTTIATFCFAKDILCAPNSGINSAQAYFRKFIGKRNLKFKYVPGQRSFSEIHISFFFPYLDYLQNM